MGFLGSPEFWVAVAFVIFVGATARPLSRAINGWLDARAARIKAELDEARALRDEAQHLLAEYQRKQRDALKEAEAILAHARSEAERLRREAAANLDAALARRERMAMDKIAQAEAQALAELRNQTVDIAVAAAARLLAQTIDERRADALIDAAVAELDKKLH
ncbi:MAG TPA: F0F1 ATP synthase subunit B [Dongiaceae bacterium]|nr:F0F1 ATP synthase subunit B [Dongiaceae bacterium]